MKNNIRDNLLNIYLERYSSELNIKTELNQTISIPIAILLAMTGFLLAEINEISNIGLKSNDFALSVLLISFVLTLVEIYLINRNFRLNTMIDFLKYKIVYITPLLLAIYLRFKFGVFSWGDCNLHGFNYILITAIVLCFLLLIAVLWNIKQFLIGFKYYYIPLPEYIIEYENELKRYYYEIHEESIKEKIDADINEYYYSELKKSHQENYENNKQKSYLLNKIKIYTVVNLVLILIIKVSSICIKQGVL